MLFWKRWRPSCRGWRRRWQQQGGLSPGDAWRAWLDMLICDHGLLRALYPNRFTVAAHFERSGHPTPWQVRAAARRGVRTLVNLRGGVPTGSHWLARETCERLGIRYLDLVMPSRDAPSRSQLHAAARLLATLEYPVLVHCKQGADRAGLMSALYLLLREGRPVEQAARELAWYYGHVRQMRTGILDDFLDSYRRSMPNPPIPFLEWVDQVYDPAALRRAWRKTAHSADPSAADD